MLLEPLHEVIELLVTFLDARLHLVYDLLLRVLTELTALLDDVINVLLLQISTTTTSECEYYLCNDMLNEVTTWQSNKA